MPTISIPSKGLEFFYTDSGAPSVENYTTLIIVHGHTYHSAAFQRLLPHAASHSLRIVCINRRGYPGSTPFTPQELKVFNEGSDPERAKLVEGEGINLGLFIHGLIKECSLPKDGGIAVAAWSLGNTFLVSFVASISLLPAETQAILKTYIKKIILWEPPSHALGYPEPPQAYIPLWDNDLAPEARGPVFGVYVASYWKHGDISTHDLNVLSYRDADPLRKPSTDNMTQEQLFSITDFTAGDLAGETILVEPGKFESVLLKQTEKAFFSPAVRAEWSGTKFWHLCGDSVSWNIIYGGWCLQDKVKALNGPQYEIHFRGVDGANHFLMWDDPVKALDSLDYCVKS